MKSILAVLAITVIGTSMLSGCKKPVPIKPEVIDYDAQLPAGQLALRKITDPKDIPDFTPAFGNQKNLREAIDRSLSYLAKASSNRPGIFPYGDITHEQAVASLVAFKQLLDSSPSPSQLNATVRQKFDVYISVGCDNKGTVRFTGYYTPILNASRTRTEQFRYPLYRLPAQVEHTPDGTVALRGQDREAIEKGNLLAGQELAYLSDPFEVYIAQVQGSAILRLPEGLVTVGFAGYNGFEYHSIRDELLNDNKIPKAEISLQAMIKYFKAHPQEVSTYTRRNPRFIFFAESTGNPRGCLNEPVTEMRTIATDKAVFPRACLAFLSTTLPTPMGGQMVDRPYAGFALDQDRGGAIRAAGRSDLYMGVGDAAGERAGHCVQDGKLYYLFLKPTAATPPALPPMAEPAPK